MELYLFDDKGYIRAYDQGKNEWYKVCPSDQVNEEHFFEHGEEDLNNIPYVKLHELSKDVQVLIYTDDPEVEELKLVIEGEYNFLYDLKNPQLLTWTSDTSTTEKTTTTVFVPKPQIVFPSGDTDIRGVHTIQKFNLIANEAGGGVVRVIVSVDSGETWMSFKDSEWKELEDLELETVKENGMSLDELNALTSEQIEELRNGSSTIRFAYYLEIVNPTDVAETDHLEMVVDLYGDWVEAEEGIDYEGSYDKETRIVTIDVLSSGNYKVNY